MYECIFNMTTKEFVYYMTKAKGIYYGKTHDNVEDIIALKEDESTVTFNVIGKKYKAEVIVRKE